MWKCNNLQHAAVHSVYNHITTDAAANIPAMSSVAFAYELAMVQIRSFRRRYVRLCRMARVFSAFSATSADGVIYKMESCSHERPR